MTGIKAIVALTIGAGAVLALADRGENRLAGGKGPVVRVVPAAATIAVGDSLRLNATLLDDDGEEVRGQRFTWWSPDRRVAEVNDGGLVVAMRAGSVTIAAITEDRSQSGFADITVVAENRAGRASADENAGPGGVAASADRNPEPEPGVDAASGASRVEPAGTANVGPGPNEPPGFVEQVQRTFDAYDENGWRDRHHGGNQAISNGVMRITYPAGFVGGSSPGSSSVYFGRDVDGFRSVYVAHDLLLSYNWQGHGSEQNKIWFFNAPDGNRTILTVKAHGGPGASEFTLVPTVKQTKDPVQGRGRGANLYPNLGGPKIHRGQRQSIEILVTMNSAPGVRDGELHIWIDGAKTHEYTPQRGNGINWYDDGDGSRIGQLKWTPVWGGIGGRVQSVMFMEMGSVYVSAR
jgi:hypothetical protein